MDCQTNSAETTETVSASHQLSKLLGQHLDRRTSRPAAMGRSPRCACCHARDLDLACFGQVGLEAALRWCSALYCRSGQADADMDDCSQPAANPHARCSMCWVTNVEGGKRSFAAGAMALRFLLRSGHSARNTGPELAALRMSDCNGNNRHAATVASTQRSRYT